MERAATWITTHRGLVALMMVGITLVSAWGYVAEPIYKRVERTGRTSDTLGVSDVFRRDRLDCFLVIQTPDLFTPKTVQAVRAVARAIEELEYVERLVWADTVPVLNVFGLDRPLLPADDASVEQFREARHDTLEHPLVRGQLISEDGRTLLMPITFDWLFVTDDEDCSSRLVAVARRTASAFPDARLEIGLTGDVPLYIAHRTAFHRNQRKFQIIGYGLVFLLSVLLFRGIRAVLIVAGAPALGIFWTMGILQLFDQLNNSLTNVVLPVLLTMVGFTDGVHLIVHIRRVRSQGFSPLESAHSAIKQVGLACALTSLTTAIGFASLMVAQSEFVRGFGRSCAIGVSLSFLAVVTFIPLVCSTRVAANIHVGQERDLVGKGLSQLTWIVDWIVRYPRWISAAGIALTLALAGVAMTLRPDDRLANSQPTGSEAYRALAHCDSEMGGIEFIQVMVEWSEDIPSNSTLIPTAIKDAEVRLEAERLIQHPLSIRNILNSLPGEQDLETRMSFLELLPDDTRAAFYNAELRRALITARIQDLGIARYEPVFQRLEQSLAELGEQHPDMKFELRGAPVSRSRNLSQILEDLLASLGTASVVIFVVMTITYRSLRIGLITIVPNMFPLVVTATVLVVTGQPLELAGVCAFTVCLGIAVDDTIHFLTRFQTELEADDGTSAAIRRTFLGVGTALTITTLISVAGFSSVLTSDLPGHRSFAAMACSTIGAALIGDLLFLPAMLVAFTPAARPQQAETAASRSAVEE